MFRKLILLLVSSVSCFSSALFAVGLGEYELMSGLNQPLKAEIKLLSAGDLSDHEVQASLASTAVFERVGVDRPYFLNGIRFETVRVNNELVIKLTSREPIKEPFLNFLVELNSPKERVIREYTFLLDPPVFDDSTSSTIQQSETEKTSSSQQRQAPPRQQRAAEPETTSTYTGSSYGPVSANDTLWSIASKVRPSSNVSIHQTLVAIYRANPEAFSNGNINNLLKGKVLTIPDAESIRQVPHRAALQDVVLQNRQWQSGGARQIVENRQGGTATREMSGDARLTLATPDDNQTSEGSSSGLQSNLTQTRNQLVRAQETSATLQAENDELRARLSDALKKLEAVKDSGAVNISDTELAALTKSSQQEEQTSALVEDADSAGIDYTDSEGSLGADASDAEITGDNASIDEGAAESEEMVSNSTEQVAQNEASAAPVATNQVYVPPQLEKGFFEELLDSGAVLGGLALAVLLIVIAVFWRMRKRMEEEDFQDDLVATTGAGLMDGTESFELPNVGDDMLVELDMDDEGEEPRGSNEETFDPLGEADIYIAYGKYEQAESLLLEAIDENPIRSDLKVKLMECYAENDDHEKFESLAQEVSQAVDAEEWHEQISALRDQAWSGKAESENEFDLPSTEDIFGSDEFNLDDEEPTPARLDLDEADSLDDDFSLDDEESDEEEFDIDMELGEEKEKVPMSQKVTETFDAIDDDDFSLDEDDDELSLGLDDEESIDLDDSEDIALDLDDEEFDFDEEESDFEGETGDDSGDEIATKLDLARAYIDMGDADGAKEILSEVLSEGSDVQKQEARKLLEKAD